MLLTYLTTYNSGTVTSMTAYDLEMCEGGDHVADDVFHRDMKHGSTCPTQYSSNR